MPPGAPITGKQEGVSALWELPLGGEGGLKDVAAFHVSNNSAGPRSRLRGADLVAVPKGQESWGESKPAVGAVN